MKVLKFSLVLLIGSGFIFAGGSGVKFYGIKSAKIDYEIKGSGNMMGMGKIKTIGKKRLVFDDYGVRKLEEENKVTKQVVMGKAHVDKVHSLVYTNGNIAYRVDFRRKQIMRTANIGASIAASLGGDDLVKKGEQMLKRMGGKKIGKDKVAGVSCDVWKVMGVKQCLYKGVPLKIESNIMGIKTVEVATKAEFDISLNYSDFKLPNFDVYQLDMDKMMSGGKPQKLDKSKLEQMDKEANAKADSEAKENKEMMKKVAANGLLPTIKSKMLEQEKMMLFAKECFKDADTLAEANKCTKEVNKQTQDKHKPFKKWNKSMKQALLNDISRGLKSMDCIKKASSMKELGVCTK